METIILLSEKKWHKDLFLQLKITFPNYNWIHIDNKIDFNSKQLEFYKPIKIFIPHWSYIIPHEIFINYECIVFHMTDLPYGRGGSPLQNLIVRGHKETKISALKVEDGIDTGFIYLKKTLQLNGTAHEILLRSSAIIEEMIFEILNDDLKPVPQVGIVEIFKRRKPEESNIAHLENLEQVYDYIRMLDGEGYPNAFLEFGKFKIEFSNAIHNSEHEILANVRIIKK